MKVSSESYLIWNLSYSYRIMSKSRDSLLGVELGFSDTLLVSRVYVFSFVLSLSWTSEMYSYIG